MFYRHILVFTPLALLSLPVHSQNHNFTEWKVYTVLNIDTVIDDQHNNTYNWFEYLYAIQHIQVTDQKDTFIIGRTINLAKREPIEDDLKIGSSYIFITYDYAPCDCSLPKLSGKCLKNKETDTVRFYPYNNHLLTDYTSIKMIVAWYPKL